MTNLYRYDKEEYQKSWLRHLVPWCFSDIKWYKPWQLITWALLGNDHDSPLGTSPKSGEVWIKKYGMGKKCQPKCVWHHGEISFKRLLLWNLRNPLHNLFFFVLGISYLKDIPQFHVVTLGQTSRFMKEEGRSVWPQGEYGASFVLRYYVLPFFSVRTPLGFGKKFEFYIGWRERGAFGMALRFKTS